MFAVVLYKNNEFVKVFGFVNNEAEYIEIANKIADANGGAERLASLGYKLCAELAM